MTFPTSLPKRNIGILLSGIGSTAIALSWAIKYDPELSDYCRLVFVGSNNNKHKISRYSIQDQSKVVIHNSEKQLLEQLNAADVDVVLLAGYMPILSAKFLKHNFQGRILNSHPSLLPAYKGIVNFEHIMINECMTGVTVHEVTKDVDGGRILDQISIRVPMNTFAEDFRMQVKAIEQAFYPFVLKKALRGHYRKDPPC